jgi:hypothetical protein
VRALELAAKRRRYYSNWIRLEPARLSILEGIVVFLFGRCQPRRGAGLLPAERRTPTRRAPASIARREERSIPSGM